ncbi:MAG TPA: 2-succinyl-6-hydroxy-2,4-cyclohexadiene-1-carboxylate synthase [Chroococcidiopsis sp.]
MEQQIRLEPYIFNYDSQGKSTDFPILFLHGFMGDRHEFSDVIPHLSSHFYCVAVDLPGHGNTQVTAGANYYQMSSTAHGLIEFLDALGIEQCVLVGYSMGGRLALYLALHFPQRFVRVILESASPGLETQAERDQRRQHDFSRAQALETQPFSQFLDHWYDQPLFQSIKAHPDFAKLRQRRLQNDPLELAKSLRYLGTGMQPSLWPNLQTNPVPLLLIVGERDQKFVAINTAMRDRSQPPFPQPQLEIIPHCGHNVHWEDANAFVHHVHTFLADLSSKADVS